MYGHTHTKLLHLTQRYDQQIYSILQQQVFVVRKQQAILHRLKEKPVLTRKQVEKQDLFVQQQHQGKMPKKVEERIELARVQQVLLQLLLQALLSVLQKQQGRLEQQLKTLKERRQETNPASQVLCEYLHGEHVFLLQDQPSVLFLYLEPLCEKVYLQNIWINLIPVQCVCDQFLRQGCVHRHKDL